MSDGIAARLGENVVLYAALAANIGIGVAKFVAAALTGSSSMLTEGFHSCVDSANQILLLHGQRRADRPPDADHPFGYGRELYFWAFVVAILIFAVGAGASIYEGVQHIRAPEPLGDPTIAYVVLGVSALMEGTSWTLAIREFARTKRADESWWHAVHTSKDPSTFIVLFEDSAALIGLVLAAAGVWASHRFADPRLDGVASIAIGAILAAVAAVLASEAKGLLIGERADPEVVHAVRDLLERQPGIVAVNHVRTVHTAPDRIFVAISADFDDAMTMGDGETLVDRIERQLKAAMPSLSSIYIRPEKRADAAAIPAP